MRSWKESLIAVAKVVNDAAVPDDAGRGSSTAFRRPSKRIDFILSGKDSDERDQLVIVELKQWETAQEDGPGRDRAHPVRRR